MTNILYISWTENMSGGEISFINYVKELGKTRFNPLFICPKQGKLSQELIKENIPVQCMPLHSFSFKKPWKFFISLTKLILFIKKERIGLIHNTTFYSNQPAIVAGKICGVPVVTHGQSFPTSKEIKRNLLRYANKIIACSNAVKKSLLPYVNETKIEVLWHAVRLPELKRKNFSLRKELGLPTNYALIGHIGLLEKRKRQEDLIKAASIVVAKNKKVKFVIIGNSPFRTTDYENYLRQLTKTENVEDSIIFLGFRDDVKQLLSELDIVTLPSLNEPFALVMIEAMACGKPFIGADSGGTPELVHHKKNGILVPPENPAALAQSIIELLENKKIAKNIGENGRKTVAQDCNIETFVSKLSEIYTSLLAAAEGKE